MEYTTKTIDSVEHDGNIFTKRSAKLVEITSDSGKIYMIHTSEYGNSQLSKYNGKYWRTLKGAQRNFDKARYWVDLYNSFDEEK